MRSTEHAKVALMNEFVTIDQPSTWRSKVGDYLSLERNVSIAAGAVFILGLGEELWKKFVPKYLEALGASTPIVGLYGTAQDFFDAVYQYPGGWLADYLGRRRAFLILWRWPRLGISSTYLVLHGRSSSLDSPW